MTVTPIHDADRTAAPADVQERERRKRRLAASYRLFARFGLDEGAAEIGRAHV